MALDYSDDKFKSYFKKTKNTLHYAFILRTYCSFLFINYLTDELKNLSGLKGWKTEWNKANRV